LSTEEYQQLEKNILEEGIREPKITCWGNTIIDGHNRYEIAVKHGLKYETLDMMFYDRDEIKIWMIDNQLGRRNLPAFVRTELQLKKKNILKIKGTEQMSSGLTILSNLETKPHNTRKEIAKNSNVSEGTVHKVEKIIEKAPEIVKEKCRTGEISINQAYKQIKKQENEIERKETLQTKAKELPNDVFQVIYCDPPWQYNNSGLNGSADSKYTTMPIEDLCKMNIKSITTENAVMFMWATNPLMEDALKLINAWGFEYKTNMVWVKENSNYGKLGFYIYGQHELLLIAVKGSMLPLGDKPNSIITGSNSVHSKKPDCVYEIIEKMYPDLKYVELFARNTVRENWTKWGNEVGKFV
jgi:N6-adenosine-specific RNA methylase IME4